MKNSDFVSKKKDFFIFIYNHIPPAMSTDQPTTEKPLRLLTAQEFIDIIIEVNREQYAEFYQAKGRYGEEVIFFEDIQVTETVILTDDVTVYSPIIIRSGKFCEDFRIEGGTFHSALTISGSGFEKKFSIEGAEFRGNFDIEGGTFMGGLNISGGTFSRPSGIRGGRFIGRSKIMSGTFNKLFTIGDGTFHSEFSIEGGVFNRLVARVIMS